MFLQLLLFGTFIAEAFLMPQTTALLWNSELVRSLNRRNFDTQLSLSEQLTQHVALVLLLSLLLLTYNIQHIRQRHFWFGVYLALVNLLTALRVEEETR